GPGLDPVELGGFLGPEALEVAGGPLVDFRVVDDRVLRQLGRRREQTVLHLERLDRVRAVAHLPLLLVAGVGGAILLRAVRFVPFVTSAGAAPASRRAAGVLYGSRHGVGGGRAAALAGSSLVALGHRVVRAVGA